MQDPNEDTEWNDVLRAKGIIPEKKKAEVTEDDVVNMMEEAIKSKTEAAAKPMDQMTLDELDELEDEEEEKVRHCTNRFLFLTVDNINII